MAGTKTRVLGIGVSQSPGWIGPVLAFCLALSWGSPAVRTEYRLFGGIALCTQTAVFSNRSGTDESIRFACFDLGSQTWELKQLSFLVPWENVTLLPSPNLNILKIIFIICKNLNLSPQGMYRLVMGTKKKLEKTREELSEKCVIITLDMKERIDC